MPETAMRDDHKAWWYWLAIWLPLGLWATDGVPVALVCALAVGTVQVLDYRRREGRWAAFPVQVRLGFLLLLAAGISDTLRFLNWIQLAGTSAVLAVDYCPLARLLALAPWNRTQALSVAMVKAAVLTPPRLWPDTRRWLMKATRLPLAVASPDQISPTLQ